MVLLIPVNRHTKPCILRDLQTWCVATQWQEQKAFNFLDEGHHQWLTLSLAYQGPQQCEKKEDTKNKYL